MPHPHRRPLRRGTAAAAAAAALAAGAALACSAAPSVAAGAHNCNAPKYPGSGYFTSLKVSGLSCGGGKAVTLAHYRCRVRHGKAGHCPSVAGYRCTERRTTISTEIDAVVTCRHGSRTVIYSYQQNT